MERNCKTCANRKYVIETIWHEDKHDNIIIRRPQHIGKVECQNTEFYNQFNDTPNNDNLINTTPFCYIEEAQPGWFENLVTHINKHFCENSTYCPSCKKFILYNKDDIKIGENIYYVYGSEENYDFYRYVNCPICNSEIKFKK